MSTKRKASGNGGPKKKRARTTTTTKKSSTKVRSYKVNISSQLSPFPREMITKLHYADVITTASIGAGLTANQTFRLNSIYDPDSTSAGHQPYGYDTLAGMYSRYRVFKCAWDISFAGTSDRYHWAVVPCNNAIAATSISLGMEMPLAKMGAMGYYGSHSRVKDSIWLPKLNGCSSEEYRADDRFESAIGSSPTETMPLVILIHNAATASIVVSYSVRLTYWVDLHDVVSLGQS